MAGPLRGAFVGYGNVASHGHAPAWRARTDTVMVAAAEPVAQQRERFLASFPDGRAYEDIDELFAKESLDFIDLCTPPASHPALIARALKAGLHVLCEKPLATTFEDALRIVESARVAGRVVHTVHNWLAAPACLKVSELVAAKAIGRVRSVRWETSRTGPAVVVGDQASLNWRLDPRLAGGGILTDHGWHALYCVAHWMGETPQSVRARLETRRFFELGVEDTADVDLAFAESRSASIHLTWAGVERANRVVLTGEHGSVRIDGATVVLEAADGEQRWDCPPSLSEGSHHPDRFGHVADEFIRAVLAGGQGNAGEALLCAQLIDLARASSALDGAPLSLEEGAPSPALEAVAP